VKASSAGGSTDGELLRRFVRTRDEPAFAALVRRLGPMVLGVCRRVSGDHHLAEDAFQAAFVVLARRAVEVRPAEAVRAWLYGVAVRTARGVRAVSARRLAREVSVPAVPDRAANAVEPPDAEALAALDLEIAELPEHLRAVVVLCELDGLSRKDAARCLGIAEGTLSSRLAKARKLLARGLRRRGISLSAAGLAVLAQSATVSARLIAQTSAFASATAPVPPAVATLSNGVIRTMFLQKLGLAAVCGLLLVALGATVWVAAPHASAQEPPKSSTVRPADKSDEGKKPAAKPPGPGTILLTRDESIATVTPEGTSGKDLPLPENTTCWRSSALSPDGKRVTFVVKGPGQPILTAVDDEYPLKVVVCTLAKPDEQKIVDLPSVDVTVAWTADGKRIVAAKMVELPPNVRFESVLIDPVTGKTEKPDLPAGVRVLDCAKDGKTFVVETFDAKAKKKVLGLATKGMDKIRELTELSGVPGRAMARLSPDETKILLVDGDPERKDAHKFGVSDRVYLIFVKTGKTEKLPGFPANGRATGIAWSPDGKRLAYSWQPLDDELLKKESIGREALDQETEGFLVIANADGSKAKTILNEKGKNATRLVLGWIDWR
jgi:RNA polymerase sigma factor (sigma-70 family)